MTNPNHCPPELILAGIIRQVDGRHNLSPDALAEAILKHPGSCWGPAVTPTNGHKLPVPTDNEIRADFVAWYEDTYGEPPRGIPPSNDVIKLARHLLQRWSPQPGAWPELPMQTDTELAANFRAWFKAKHDTEYFGGLALCDAIAWVKHLLQQSAQPVALMPSHKDLIDFACKQKHWKAWLEPGGCLENAHFELSDLIQVAIKKWGFQSAVVISPEAGYEQIPDDGDPEKLPRDAQQVNGEWWVPCYGANSLAKVLEQTQPSPPAAWPEISDSLIRRLVGDIAAIASETTIAVCFGNHVDPIKEARACLLEVLGLAAKEGAG